MWNDIVATAVGIILTFTGAVSHHATQFADKLGDVLVPVTSTSISYARVPRAPQQPTTGNVLGESTPTPTTPQGTVINNPIIERIIERATPAGVSEDSLNLRLAGIASLLRSEFSSFQLPRSGASAPVFTQTFAHAQRIDNLSDVTVDGVSGLTDADLPDSLTASNYLPLSGGSLTGDLSMTGTLTAGALAVSGVSSGGAIEAPYFTATSTSASSTFTNFNVTNATATNATTTNFAISGIVSSLLKTNATGGLVAAVAGTDYATFGYLFPSNATSTLLSFNGGFTSFASTTVGNGTQAGGLTISGGATTTGNAYFAGNVGIGTASPSKPLTVNGAMNFLAGGTPTAIVGPPTWDTSYASFQNGRVAESANNAALYQDANGGTTLNAASGQSLGFRISNDLGGQGGLTMSSGKLVYENGNVGIGITSPSQKLELANANYLGFRLADNSGTAFYMRANSSNEGELLTASYATPIKIDASNIQLNANGSTGNVGVATTSPWRTLSVTGTVGFDGLAGSTGAGSLCLDANKQVVYNSASDNCLSSTRATKHDINPLSLDDLGIVNALQPVSFVYNQGDGRTRFGFIAEDAAAVDAHLATYDASSTVSGIDDRSIIAILVGAIKELYAKVQEHFARTERLEERVSALEAQLAASAANDNPQPQGAEQSSDGNDPPDEKEEVDETATSTPAVADAQEEPEEPAVVEEPAAEVVAEPAEPITPEPEAANDNEPPAQLPASGTE